MELLLGDIVVGTRVVAYDSVRETSSGESVYRGMIYMRDGVQQRVSAIACAPHLVKAARSAGHVHDPWPVDLGWPAGVAHRTPHITLGTVASADRWNRAPATIAHLVATHQSLCEDMEAAAIGIVCAAHDVPFLTIKDISNNELLRQTASGTAMLTELGTSQIARRAAACTFATLEVLFS